MGIRQLYDLAYNVAKIERQTVNGRPLELCIHCKGATRSFPAGSGDIPARYGNTGQPVLIPGDMGRYSFLVVGSGMAMEGSFAAAGATA